MERLVRGILLTVWIIGLSSLGVAALTGSVSTWLLHTKPISTFRSVDPGKTGTAEMAIQLYEMWAQCFPGRGQMAPVSAVLDEIWPKWQSASRDNDNLQRPPKVWAQQWVECFNTIENWLGEYVSMEDERNRVYSVRKETVPASLRETINYDQVTALPRAAVAWIEAQRVAAANTRRALELADTGIIVIVIGAFGSLIFLLCSLVSLGQNEGTTALSVEDFFFRPFLGAFLGLAFLIVDVVTHAVVSTGSILEIRRESLYGLALAAGLLSEKAYKRLGESLAGRLVSKEQETPGDSRSPKHHNQLRRSAIQKKTHRQ